MNSIIFKAKAILFLLTVTLFSFSFAITEPIESQPLDNKSSLRNLESSDSFFITISPLNNDFVVSFKTDHIVVNAVQNLTNGITIDKHSYCFFDPYDQKEITLQSGSILSVESLSPTKTFRISGTLFFGPQKIFTVFFHDNDNNKALKMSCTSSIFPYVSNGNWYINTFPEFEKFKEAFARHGLKLDIQFSAKNSSLR